MDTLTGVLEMITKSEAIDALRETEVVRARVIRGKSYDHASPHLLIAGAIWVLGYVGTGLTRPARWMYVWVPLIILGVLAGLAITLRSQRRARSALMPASPVANAAGMLWSMSAIMIFTAATFLLFRPQSVLPYLVFPPLLMGLVYMLMGSYGLPRFRWIGLCIFALTCLGVLIAPTFICYWIAMVGGGGLIVGSFWLRKF